jgi:aryl-alcohol dehydrogenase-like predicted oxidoreductase
MKYINVGGTDLSKIIFGCWGISGDWKDREFSLADRQNLIMAAWEQGINFFDTAPVYGGGVMEEVFKDLDINKKIFIATKVPAREKPNDNDLKNFDYYYDEKYIREFLEGSLKRLGRECVDLLQLHNWHKSWNEHLDYFVEPLIKLQKEGLIKNIGISLPDRYELPFENLISQGNINFVHLDYNIIDPWAREYFDNLKVGKAVHLMVRSLFSQGVVGALIDHMEILTPEDLRAKRYLFQKEIIGKKVHEYCEDKGITIEQIYSKLIEEVSDKIGENFINVGMRTKTQILNNCRTLV